MCFSFQNPIFHLQVSVGTGFIWYVGLLMFTANGTPSQDVGRCLVHVMQGLAAVTAVTEQFNNI